MPTPDPVHNSPVKGEVIKRLRAESGIARAKLAVQANVADSTWQRAERGDSVSYRNLVKIARTLGVPVSEIYEDALDIELPSDLPEPAWFTQYAEQQSARLRSIEATQAEILRALRSNR